MKKKFLSLVMAMAMMLGLAACGGGKQAEPAYFRRSRKGLRPEPAVCTRPG